MSSYDVSYGFEVTTIYRHADNTAPYKSFAEVNAETQKRLRGDLAAYDVGVQVKNERHRKMSLLLRHLQGCTEEDCEILVDFDPRKGEQKFPKPAQQ
jgi:hypothetical protein